MEQTLDVSNFTIHSTPDDLIRLMGSEDFADSGVCIQVIFYETKITFHSTLSISL